MGETRSYDNDYSGKIETDNRYPITSGQTIVKGQALALVASKLVAFDSGSNSFHSIAVRDVDASGGDVYTDYIVKAEDYNGAKIVFANGADTWQSIYAAARALGINIRATIPADLTMLESESEA